MKRAWHKMAGRGHGEKCGEEGMAKNGGKRTWQKRREEDMAKKAGRGHGKKWQEEGMAKNGGKRAWRKMVGRGHDTK